MNGPRDIRPKGGSGCQYFVILIAICRPSIRQRCSRQLTQRWRNSPPAPARNFEMPVAKEAKNGRSLAASQPHEKKPLGTYQSGDPGQDECVIGVMVGDVRRWRPPDDPSAWPGPRGVAWCAVKVAVGRGGLSAYTGPQGHKSAGRMTSACRRAGGGSRSLSAEAPPGGAVESPIDSNTDIIRDVAPRAAQIRDGYDDRLYSMRRFDKKPGLEPVRGGTRRA